MLKKVLLSRPKLEIRTVTAGSDLRHPVAADRILKISKDEFVKLEMLVLWAKSQANWQVDKLLRCYQITDQNDPYGHISLKVPNF